MCLKITSHDKFIHSWDWFLDWSKETLLCFIPENIFNALNNWIEKQPHLIQPPNVTDSIFVKVNGTIVKKQKRLIQISVRELHNDLILPASQGGFYGARNKYGKVCIWYMSLRNYTPKHIKPTSKINNIKCGWETCISAMLLQYVLNKLGLTQSEKLISCI